MEFDCSFFKDVLDDSMVGVSNSTSSFVSHGSYTCDAGLQTSVVTSLEKSKDGGRGKSKMDTIEGGTWYGSSLYDGGCPIYDG
jgi:hypothetical protein